jgi:hypothetical protein
MNEIRGLSSEIVKLGGIFPQVMRELEHYRDNHRLLLVLSCAFAELMIGTLIEDKCRKGKQINGNNRDFPFSVRLTLLNEMGLLDPVHFDRLNWLRQQRNDAAHKPDFRFTADRLPTWGGDDHRTPDKLFSLCVNVLGVFWNQHVELFRKKLPFEPVERRIRS